MDVTVNMTAEEFQEFMEWRRDRSNYTEIIVDQEHAVELLKMAREYLA